jgi:hypothetical protein
MFRYYVLLFLAACLEAGLAKVLDLGWERFSEDGFDVIDF